jgi:hypothetical protein
MKKWTKEELEQAIKLLKNGCKYDEIAIELKRTNRSIKNKLEEEGLKYYEVNPTTEQRACLNCKEKFKTSKIGKGKFCGSSCAASYNNKKSKRKYEIFVKCKNCNKDIKNLERGNRKYCDNTCKSEFEKKEKFNLIEKGDKSLYIKWYKKYLIYKHGEKCMECGWCERSKYSNNVPIELEHIDGDSENNNLINLKLLCPNCHSLTPTYKALNKGNGRHSRMQRYKDGKSY